MTVRTTLLSHVKEALVAGVRQVIFGGESFSHRSIPWKDYEGTTADAGIALYAGMAIASVMGTGVVFTSRKRKNH